MTAKITTIDQLLKSASNNYPDYCLLTYKSGGRIVNESFSEFYLSAHIWGTFLRSRGVKEGERVMIVTSKCPAQLRAVHGCWQAGCIAVPVCETLEDEMGFIEQDCWPSMILVEDKLFDKITKRFPKQNVVTFDDVIRYEAEHSEIGEPVTIHKTISTDAPAVLIYTSGSTGNPKGVITTHKNLLMNATSAARHLKAKNEILLSLLPYWHSFAMTVEVIMPLYTCSTVAFARDRRDFIKNMGVYCPTIILSVPRIIEVMKEGILKKIAKEWKITEQLFGSAIKNSIKYKNDQFKPRGTNPVRRLAHKSADHLFFGKIRSVFGPNFKYFVTGGAPLDIELQQFFNAIGLPLLIGYGLSESSPVVSVGTLDSCRFGSAGELLDWLLPENSGDFTFRAEDGTKSKNVEGELLIKGDCVMQGYWGHTDQSAKALHDGWLFTGDMACLDDKGFLHIKGRLGNMIVLNGGEKLHPEHIEDSLKHSELIREVMVIGEKMKNVYALVNISDFALEQYGTEDLAKEHIKKEMKNLTKHLASYQKPKDILFLPTFCEEDGTYTPSMKIRRFRIKKKYSQEISQFLSNAGEC